MTVEAIIAEIGHLSDPEREQAWDREIKRDFAPGGRCERLMADVEAEIAAGRT